MREIKFRVWDKEFKKMRVTCMGLNRGVLTADESMEIMQYTGLKDLNGNEIYEGDILCIQITKYGEVVFFEDRFGVWIENEINSAKTFYPLSYASTVGEVIGNIYENPELLAPAKQPEPQSN